MRPDNISSPNPVKSFDIIVLIFENIFWKMSKNDEYIDARKNHEMEWPVGFEYSESLSS